MASNVLASKDVNTSTPTAATVDNNAIKPDVKSMEYHRQVFQSKMEQEGYAMLPLPIPNTRVVSCGGSDLKLTWVLTKQQIQDIHLPFRQHHEPLHGQAERFPEQAGWKVGLFETRQNTGRTDD